MSRSTRPSVRCRTRWVGKEQNEETRAQPCFHLVEILNSSDTPFENRTPANQDGFPVLPRAVVGNAGDAGLLVSQAIRPNEGTTQQDRRHWREWDLRVQ